MSGSATQVAVTGAGGKTGHAVVLGLLGARHPVRALVHHGEQGVALREAGATVVVGDQRRTADLETLFQGCAAVYHIPPNLSADEDVMVSAVIAAAAERGTRRVIYHSVLHPQTSAMPHHTAKLGVEERLLASGLETVFMQPAPYMQNLEPYVRRAVGGQAVTFPYSADVVLSMVHLADVGAAAAAVVDGPEHEGAAYQLCSPDVLTQGEAWDLLLARLEGVEAPYRRAPTASWVGDVDGLSARQADWLEAMFRYYDRFGLRGSPVPLRTLLGREPRGLRSYAEELARRLARSEG